MEQSQNAKPTARFYSKGKFSLKQPSSLLRLPCSEKKNVQHDYLSSINQPKHRFVWFFIPLQSFPQLPIREL